MVAASTLLCAAAVLAEQPAAPRFVERELIVRFNETVTERIDELVDAKRPLKSATTDTSDSLDRLFQEYGVVSARLLYEHVRGYGQAAAGHLATLKDLKQYERQHRQALKHKYTRRSDRAPKRTVNFDPTQVWILTLAETANVEAAAAAFSADPHVVYAQPNGVMSLQADPTFPTTLPDDTYLDPANTETWSSGLLGAGFTSPNLWGLKQIHAEQAWQITQGDPIIVAVVDSGVDYTHEDLDGNMWVNTDDPIGDMPDSCNRVADPSIAPADDDCNHYIDDIRGWNFASGGGTNNVMDTAGHGTHVAGIIAAETNNGLGVSGIAPQVKLMAVRITGDDGTLLSDAQAANAIIYAAENGADVINCSFGCTAPCPSNSTLEQAVQEVYYDDPTDPTDPAGVTVVFAAGNIPSGGKNIADFSPQNMPETIAAGSSQPNDQMLPDSNRGLLLDVVAPGDHILSLKTSQPYAGSLFYANNGCPEVGSGTYRYCYASGTSMAAPFVSGAAALLLAHRPELSNEQVRQALRATADDSTAAFRVAAATGGVTSGTTLFGGHSGIFISGDNFSGDTALMYENEQGYFEPLTLQVTAINPDGITQLGPLLYIMEGKLMITTTAPNAPGSTFNLQPQDNPAAMTGTLTWSEISPGTRVSFAALGSCGTTTFPVTFAAQTAQEMGSRSITIKLVKCGDPGNTLCTTPYLHPPMIQTIQSQGQVQDQYGGASWQAGLVGLGRPFTLTGTACDPDNPSESLTYTWSYLNSSPLGVLGPALNLQNLTQPTASGTSPSSLTQSTGLNFQLQVTDTTSRTSPAQTVTLRVDPDCVTIIGKLTASCG